MSKEKEFKMYGYETKKTSGVAFVDADVDKKDAIKAISKISDAKLVEQIGTVTAAKKNLVQWTSKENSNDIKVFIIYGR